MRKDLFLCSIPLFVLAACTAKVDDAGGNGSDNVHVAMSGGDNKVSIDVPGFAAKVSVPDIDLGSHMDLDGIRVAPRTKVGTVDVTGQDDAGAREGGKVRVGFTNPDAPAVILDHYARSAAGAGYGEIVRTATSVTARKGQKSFAVTVSPQGAGSAGAIIIAGRD